MSWAAAHELAARVRAFEVWLSSPEGLTAMAPFEKIRKLEAGNAKLRRKLEKLRGK